MSWLVVLSLLLLVLAAWLYARHRSQDESRPLPMARPPPSTESPQEGQADEFQRFEPTPLRKLGTLDVPVIQARLDKLGVFSCLQPYQKERLHRTILEHCQEGIEEPWWGPLGAFADGLRYQRGEMCAHVLVDRPRDAHQFRRDIDALGYMVRQSGLQLQDLERDGEPVPGDQPLSDGTYSLTYKRGGQDRAFPLQVQDGRIDVYGLVRELNRLLARYQPSHRVLLLPPHGERWCLLYTTLPAAERAHQARWGLLLH